MIVMPQLGKMEIKTTAGETKTYTDYKALEASSAKINLAAGVRLVCCLCVVVAARAWMGCVSARVCVLHDSFCIGQHTTRFLSFGLAQADFVAGLLHPGDVKPALARDINVSALAPANAHTRSPPLFCFRA